jgi:xanthine dehydrogenase accessory factor
MTLLTNSSAAMHQFGANCIAIGTPFVMLEITQLQGSAPRGEGVLMLVSMDLAVGTIGGGHLEFAAIDEARRLIRTQAPATPVKSYALGPSLGQCCGGRVDIAYTIVNPEQWPTVHKKLQAMVGSRFTLNLFGAGHVGAAVAQALAPLPCRVNWIDEREALFEATVQSRNISRVCVDSPAAEVALASSGDFYLVLTHSHALDLDIVQAVLKRGDAGYLGLIGSLTKRATFERRLHDLGLATTALHCPVGLVGLTGKEPEVIAASVAADLLLRASVSPSN